MKKYFRINKVITIFCFFCFAIFILCIAQTYQKQNEDDGEIDIRTGTVHDTNRSTDESLLMKEKIIYQNKRVNSVGLIQLESIGVESIEIISIDFGLPYPKTNSDSLKKHNIKNYDNIVLQESLSQKIKIIAQLTTPLSIGFRGYRINSDIASEIANISNVHTLFFDKCEIVSFPQKINFNSDHSVFILSRSEIKANLVDIFNCLEKVDSLYFWGMDFSKRTWHEIFSCNLKISQLQLFGGMLEDGSFVNINFLDSLRYVQLSHLNISWNDIDSLATLTNLISIQLTECNYENFSKNIFTNKKTLKHMRIIQDNKTTYSYEVP